MTDPGDGLKILLGPFNDLSPTANAIFGSLSAAVEILAGFGAAVQVVETLIQLFGSTIDLGTVVQIIQTDFAAVFAAQSAEDTIRQMVQVGSLLDKARAYRDFASSAQPSDPGYASESAEAIENTHAYLLQLLDQTEYMWLRLHFESDDYAPDPYTAALNLNPPQPFPGAQFDFRLTLPATLEVLCIWLLILAKLNPSDWLAERAQQLLELGQSLEYFYNKIRDGIQDIKVPNIGVDPYNGSINNGPILVESTNWIKQRPYGAVQIYAAEGLVDRYPDMRWPNATACLQDTNAQLFQLAFSEFFVRFQIGNYVRHAQIYYDFALPDVYQVINILRGLGGAPPLTADLHNGDLSIRKVWAIMKNGNYFSGPSDPNRVSVRANIITALAGSGSGFVPRLRQVLLSQ